MWFLLQGIKLPGGNLDKENWLNYTIQPLARQFCDDILSVHLLPPND